MLAYCSEINRGIDMNDKERYLSTQRRVEENARRQNRELVKSLFCGLAILFAIAMLVLKPAIA